MEHVRSDKPIRSTLMDLISPLILLAIGTNIDRQTVDNVLETGLKINKVEDLDIGYVFIIIHAFKE